MEYNEQQIKELEQILGVKDLHKIKNLKEVIHELIMEWLTLQDRVNLFKQSDCDETLFVEGFDQALLGYTEQFGEVISVYDEKRCIDLLIEKGMTETEASDYYYYNMATKYCGSKTPLFVTKF
jgi:hypothetical protein